MRSAGLFATYATCATLFVAACADIPDDPREDEVTGVLAEADEAVIRVRPALAAGKYARMTLAPLDFMRGSLSLYRHDARTGNATHLAVSRFAMDVPLVPSIGDPHFENFGTMRASDGTLAIEPNDFDAADLAPYLWDVRRVTSSMALAALQANDGDPAARAQSAAAVRSIARATAGGYRSAIEGLAAGGAPARVTAATAPTNAIFQDAFDRSDRDQAIRRELADFSDVVDGVRRLKRGVVDPADTQNVFLDVPPTAYASLPEAIERWRRTLGAPPPAEQLVLLDAARELGSGVSSWPRVRLILLVRGPTDDPSDDLLLELKELSDSGIAGLYPPGVYHDDVGNRVITMSRAAWARPDAAPLWGATEWLGLPCQIRIETQGQKNIRLSRLVGARGTPAALTEMGVVLGSIIGRVHGSGADGASHARAIYARIAVDPEGFLDEQADLAVSYAQQIIDDHARFRHAFQNRGSALGVPRDPSDDPHADFAAVLGIPPPLPPVTP